MGKRGGVRRMNSRSRDLPVPREVDDGPAPVRWDRGQDHLERFTGLIGQELEDELATVEERWRHWSKSRLVEAGLTLYDLKARPRGRLFGDPILIFEARDGGRLPVHRFSHGDMVILSRTRPWGEKTIEGLVLDRGPTRVRVVVGERPKGVRDGVWRLDRGANRVAHDRMADALLRLHDAGADDGTPLRDLLLGQVHDPESSAASPPSIGGRPRRVRADPSGNLNSSQSAAVEAALQHRLTLIQGPPGTGKTHTAVHVLSAMAAQGRGPILATAESNVAVDNLLEGLLESGVNAVRIGQPVKVRASLREATLDARLEDHPLQDDLAALRDEHDTLKRGLSGLRGKERGLAHKDLSMQRREMQRLEQQMIDGVLDDAEVVCATTVGSGHRILGARRFPIVLVDEATQASEPSSLVPIVRGCRHLVLVGDQCQLPPTVISDRAAEGGLGRSLFERLIDLGLPTHMLTMQYRMHPSIREFPGARFYEGRLEDGCAREERPPPAGFLWPDWDRPVAFVPVDGEEELDAERASKANRDQAAATFGIVNDLLSAGDLEGSDVGVVTPYTAQVRLLTDLFDEGGGLGEGGRFHGLEVRSVDGYQGREKEVIVFCTVRSNPKGEIGFLADRRRLNVAITRARRGLVMVGHPQTLRRDGTWRAWLDWAEELGLMAWHVGRA